MRHAESEAQFIRFGNIIGYVLAIHPAATQIDPKPLSVETYAARFRDAVKAKRKYGYKHLAISENLWNEHNESLTTHMGDGFVLLGTRDGIKRYLAKSVGEVLTADNKPELELNGNQHAHLEPLCAMLSARALIPAPVIIVHLPLPDTVKRLEQRYDVSFLPIPNRPDHYRLT